MAQEEKPNGSDLSSGTEVGSVNSGNRICSLCVHRKVIDTKLSDLPPEAITAAVNNFSAAAGICAVLTLILCWFYPDRFQNAITILGPTAGAAFAFYCKLRAEQVTKRD